MRISRIIVMLFAVLSASDVSNARRSDWVMAEDGSLYTLPVGSEEVLIGRLDS